MLQRLRTCSLNMEVKGGKGSNLQTCIQVIVGLSLKLTMLNLLLMV